MRAFYTYLERYSELTDEHGRSVPDPMSTIVRRRTWFAISGLIIVVSVSSLALRGVNLGIDFKGGVQITFKTRELTPLAKVRAQTEAIGHGKDAVVQGRGPGQGDSYRSFQIRLPKLSYAEQSKLTQGLRQRARATSRGLKNVSSSFGKQITRSALIAVFFSLLIITLYISIRFRGIAFAVPVIVALLHDILITIGIYSLSGREVTEATVAAILTVLGYSIYDTIIIFDRIRENIPVMRRSSFATIANVSLWETIRRSVATTLITLIPVASLFFFGGATLKDFAFALLIGIASGAYSSIFIAAPLLAWWKEREPEYARRRGNVGDEEPHQTRPTAAQMFDPPIATVAPAPREPLAKRDQRRVRRQERH